MRGQLAIEALVLLGASLAVLLTLSVAALGAASDLSRQLGAQKARLAVSALADAARSVYYQGDGALQTLWVLLPDDVSSLEAGNRTILLVTASEMFHENLPFNVSGSLPAEPGLRRMQANATASGVVIGVAP